MLWDGKLAVCPQFLSFVECKCYDLFAHGNCLTFSVNYFFFVWKKAQGEKKDSECNKADT